MTDESPVNQETVRVLAAAAELRLASERAALIAPMLNIWMRQANELSEKMSAPEHWLLSPVTSFKVHRS